MEGPAKTFGFYYSTYCSQKHGCALFLDPPGRKSRSKVAEFTHPDPAELVSFLKANTSLYTQQDAG